MSIASLARAGSLAALAGLLLVSGGCARQVTRIAPEQAVDLSGRWNDVDSRLVAEEIIRESFDAAAGQSWALRHTQVHGGRRPAVIVGTVRNRSMEHIPVGTFVRDLERAYVRSGLVQVVASPTEREEVRDERFDQQEFAAADTRARLGKELGADYMLQGDIQSIEDREGRRSVVYYQVDMTLVDLETNQKTWVGQHKIKKFVERPRVRL
ncbi:MAG TPA: penicillin-binding protein activator LpoB [Longimicrobiaceae bacterium]|nr:penicillin-binding protein activator LpoB [Longimicrobiaceae bacterium]